MTVIYDVPMEVIANKNDTSLSIGSMGEFLTAYNLVKLGYPTEIVRLEKIDLLTVVHNHKPLRIQVKTTKQRYHRSNRSNANHKAYYSYHFSVCSGSKPKYPLSKNDCDIVALVAIDLERIFFVRTKELDGCLTKRMTPTKFYDGCTQTTWDNCLRKKPQFVEL
tara:strand:- start:522 stop:1013 length:492 start_codon:yes stop_codon:yes gene_type:complete